MCTRRRLLKILGAIPFFLLFKPLHSTNATPKRSKAIDFTTSVYRVISGEPADNMKKVIELIGGIDSFIDQDDIVVIKPNVQWWNQGAPNITALNTFIDIVMNRPGGFKGEVVIAENCHRGHEPWKAGGWRHHFERNSSDDGLKNYSALSKRLKAKYGDQYSTVHWINVRYGAERVFSPEDGVGYVYCDGSGGVPKISFDNGASGEDYRETIMTYPIFRTDRGTIVDYKNGVYESGGFNHNRFKFINFAALNHHSYYCGMTSLIKNYLGVSDLSGGPDPFSGGKLTDRYYNFHSFPFNKWSPGPKAGMIGAEIGVFLSTVRKPAMNIVTADWVGLASRTDLPAARTRSVLAATDPVALDFHSAKYILYPNSRICFHNPEDPTSPTHQYLKACADYGGGIFDELKVAVQSWDLKADRLQREDELFVFGDCHWGSNVKALCRYALFRWFPYLVS